MLRRVAVSVLSPSAPSISELFRVRIPNIREIRSDSETFKLLSHVVNVLTSAASKLKIELNVTLSFNMLLYLAEP